MKTYLSLLGGLVASLGVAVVIARASNAGSVEITGLHLCCAGCTTAVETALESVDGVSNLEVDRDARTARFDVRNQEAFEHALGAVAKAGFYGTVMHRGRELPLVGESPKSSAEAPHRLVLGGVHLCCKSCVRAVVKAVAEVKEVATVDCDLESQCVTITGTELDVEAIFTALHEAGFHGEVEEEE